MPATWSVQEAKKRFGELIERARREGPQHVARRGREAAVVLSADDYRRLLAGQPSLKDWPLMARPGCPSKRLPARCSSAASDPRLLNPYRTTGTGSES